ncbi:hypothetical protein C8Q80DRAFT_363460 [Daedaleopsis nitida]|nr:hypothetical protein C8Q80DRAFT_363460 [Daedaleopsis nitida]
MLASPCINLSQTHLHVTTLRPQVRPQCPIRDIARARARDLAHCAHPSPSCCLPVHAIILVSPADARTPTFGLSQHRKQHLQIRAQRTRERARAGRPTSLETFPACGSPGIVFLPQLAGRARSFDLRVRSIRTDGRYRYARKARMPISKRRAPAENQPSRPSVRPSVRPCSCSESSPRAPSPSAYVRMTLCLRARALPWPRMRNRGTLVANLRSRQRVQRVHCRRTSTYRGPSRFYVHLHLL